MNSYKNVFLSVHGKKCAKIDECLRTHKQVVGPTVQRVHCPVRGEEVPFVLHAYELPQLTELFIVPPSTS